MENENGTVLEDIRIPLILIFAAAETSRRHGNKASNIHTYLAGVVINKQHREVKNSQLRGPLLNPGGTVADQEQLVC